MTNSIVLLALSTLLSPAFAEDLPASEWLATSVTQDDAAPVVAQDTEEDSDEDPAEAKDSVRAEREAVKSGSADKDKTSATENDEDRRRRIIKTIQRKNFIKVGRFEAGPSIGFVANDPFLNRNIIGGVFDYHITEIFAAEVQLGYAPSFGSGGEEDPDWKPLSKQLLKSNSVVPDISKFGANGSAGFSFSPIYGKAAVGKRIIAFDIYGQFGLGFTASKDDLEALQLDQSERDEAVATETQVHPSTVYGGGARVAFNQSLALRVEGKAMSYIEVVKSENLAMKNNVILQASVSFFFPGMD